MQTSGPNTSQDLDGQRRKCWNGGGHFHTCNAGKLLQQCNGKLVSHWLINKDGQKCLPDLSYISISQSFGLAQQAHLLPPRLSNCLSYSCIPRIHSPSHSRWVNLSCRVCEIVVQIWYMDAWVHLPFLTGTTFGLRVLSASNGGTRGEWALPAQISFTALHGAGPRRRHRRAALVAPLVAQRAGSPGKPWSDRPNGTNIAHP